MKMKVRTVLGLQEVSIIPENPHKHWYLRQSQPSWSPALHQETRAFVAERVDDDLAYALRAVLASLAVTPRRVTYWSDSVDSHGILHSALQDICRGAGRCCHRSCKEGGKEMGGHAIFETEGGIG